MFVVDAIETLAGHDPHDSANVTESYKSFDLDSIDEHLAVKTFTVGIPQVRLLLPSSLLSKFIIDRPFRRAIVVIRPFITFLIADQTAWTNASRSLVYAFPPTTIMCSAGSK